MAKVIDFPGLAPALSPVYATPEPVEATRGRQRGFLDVVPGGKRWGQKSSL
jgi:hypothetical protein